MTEGNYENAYIVLEKLAASDEAGKLVAEFKTAVFNYAMYRNKAPSYGGPDNPFIRQAYEKTNSAYQSIRDFLEQIRKGASQLLPDEKGFIDDLADKELEGITKK